MPWDATAAHANDKADNGLNGNTFSGMRFYRIGNRWASGHYGWGRHRASLRRVAGSLRPNP